MSGPNFGFRVTNPVFSALVVVWGGSGVTLADVAGRPASAKKGCDGHSGTDDCGDSRSDGSKRGNHGQAISGHVGDSAGLTMGRSG